MTPAQCRAARDLLGWSKTNSPRMVAWARSSVADFELNRCPVSETIRQKLLLAFEDAGVEFTNGKRPGVRLT